MQKLLLIYNPTSGKGHTRANLATAIDVFTQHGWLVTAYPTQSQGDATRVARELGGDFDRVVCSGGDGTLSETVAGLMDLPHPPILGFLPAGSTNDCGVSLDLPSQPAKAAALAAGDGIPRPWDVGKLNGRPFVYVAAFGAFTQVSYATPQDLKNALGHLAYVVAGIASIPTITPYHMRVEYDGHVIEDDFYYGMVCNTYSIGGMKNIVAGKVDLADGRVEVVLVKKPLGMDEVAGALQNLLFPNEPNDRSAVLSFHASRLTFTCDQSIPWTLDGEYGGSYDKAEAENCKQALTIIRGK